MQEGDDPLTTPEPLQEQSAGLMIWKMLCMPDIGWRSSSSKARPGGSGRLERPSMLWVHNSA